MNYKIIFLLCIPAINIYSMDTPLEFHLLEHAQRLVKEYQQDSHNPKPIIGIGGGSQVGKTTFSKILLALLSNNNINAKILPLDNFFAPNLPYTLECDEFNNRVGNPVGQFNHRVMQAALSKIKQRDAVVDIPGDNKDQNRRRIIEPFNFADLDLVLFEGIYALTGPDTYNLAMYSQLKIFIEAKKEDHMNWYCDRRRRQGCVNPEHDPITEWDFNVDFANVIAPTKKNADMVITHHANHSYTFMDIPKE